MLRLLMTTIGSFSDHPHRRIGGGEQAISGLLSSLPARPKSRAVTHGNLLQFCRQLGGLDSFGRSSHIKDDCRRDNATNACSNMTEPSRSFAHHHRWDAVAFPSFVLLIWFVILLGFVPEIVDQLRTSSFDYPFLTHVHALVFVGWLVILTVQTALVRSHNVGLHRRLGRTAVVLVPLVVALGLIASISMFHRLYAPNFPPLSLSMRFADMASFGTAAVAGLVLRNKPSAHKRLMLLATFCLAAAGFGRIWGDWMLARFGPGFAGRWSFDYLGVTILILLVASYDLVTRHRLNRPYITTAAAVIIIEAVGAFVRDLPGWKPVAIMLIGR